MAHPPIDPQAIPLSQPECSADRYLDLRFLVLYTTGPAQKEPLIQYAASSSQGIDADTYRTGVVNTHASTGLHVLLGQWRTPDSAFELGGTYITPFFYKRYYAAVTTAATAFTPGSRSTVEFLPTQTPLDGAYIYYHAEHWGTEANWRRRVSEDPCHWLDAIVGVRYHQIHERYSITAFPVGGAAVWETYHTGNDIVGLQLGVESDRRLADYVSLRGVAKYMVGFNSQWQNFQGTPGQVLLTSDPYRGYQENLKFGNFADFSLAVVAKLTPRIETSLGATTLIFGGVKRAADTFDLASLPTPALRSGQDWLVLYGIQWTVKFDF